MTQNSDQYNTKEGGYKLKMDTIIIAGSSRLPENITAKHVFGYLTIELEINYSDSVIVDVSCTLLPSLGKKMLCKALLGNKIGEGINNAIKQLEQRFSGATKKAMIAALEDVYRQYKKFREEINNRLPNNAALPINL